MGLQRFCTLASMEGRETMTILSVATKLRLTVPSRHKAERAATLDEKRAAAMGN
jgi:hypothetical protein